MQGLENLLAIKFEHHLIEASVVLGDNMSSRKGMQKKGKR